MAPSAPALLPILGRREELDAEIVREAYIIRRLDQITRQAGEHVATAERDLRDRGWSFDDDEEEP